MWRTTEFCPSDSTPSHYLTIKTYCIECCWLTLINRDLNFLIMDYLINEGYPDAAMNFAKEASIVPSADGEAIQERVNIRNAIHTGDMQLAIERINELNPQVSLHPSTHSPHTLLL
jgi:hypothetical protein